MPETFKEIAAALILALICGLGAYILKLNKKNILAAILNLVKEAEAAVTGSKLGEEKKKIVVAQLEAMGIKVTDWVSAQIDSTVAYLNAKGGWLLKSAADGSGKAAELGSGTDAQKPIT